MAEASDARAMLRQNLADAGCGGELTEQILRLSADGRIAQEIALLLEHRRAVLDGCHAAQRRLDCLDYLIYRLRQKQKAGGNDHDEL